jgi:hypothetical protein
MWFGPTGRRISPERLDSRYTQQQVEQQKESTQQATLCA